MHRRVTFVGPTGCQVGYVTRRGPFVRSVLHYENEVNEEASSLSRLPLRSLSHDIYFFLNRRIADTGIAAAVPILARDAAAMRYQPQAQPCIYLL
jgi:hypothetical protein